MTTPTTPPAPQSNQHAGADERSCPWCVLWNVAFAAMQLEHQPYDSQFEDHVCGLVSLGWSLADALAERGTLCDGCRRSAEIHQGDYLGPERRQWRAAGCRIELNPEYCDLIADRFRQRRLL